MSGIITIGSRLIAKKQIAFVEPFDQAANPNFTSSRPFHARLVLLNRESVLTEATIEAFAGMHGFRVLADDQLALNPAVPFAIERYAADTRFPTTKAYATRLRWRDAEGRDQSKLLLSAPESVVDCLQGQAGGADTKPAKIRRPRRRRAATPPTADAS